jgi:small ligand-binding sensory domain FIST
VSARSLAPRFAAALSAQPALDSAFGEACARVRSSLQGARPDLVVAFASNALAGDREGLGRRCRDELGASVVLGCGARGVLGDDAEHESGPALALWAACLPGTALRPFEVDVSQDSDLDAVFHGLPEVQDPSRAGILVLPDPFSFPAVDWIAAIEERLPGVPVVGGLAVPEHGGERALLLTADGASKSGAVGVVVEGDVEIATAVSQGCRPVGRPWVVTACDENMVLKLSGRPALEVLMEMLASLPQAEREALQRGPFLGLAVDARKSVFDRGDFLARGLMGIDKQRGGLAVADPSLRSGMSVQFLVRDPASAGEDLEHAVSSCGRARQGAASGALVFTCNGRGRRMFGAPNHDARHLRHALGEGTPVAGFFALGEIGPIGGRNFVHGFTASTAILRARG